LLDYIDGCRLARSRGPTHEEQTLAGIEVHDFKQALDTNGEILVGLKTHFLQQYRQVKVKKMLQEVCRLLRIQLLVWLKDFNEKLSKSLKS
jgi:hypothetical protein